MCIMPTIVTILEIVLAAVFFILSVVFCLVVISKFIDEVGGNKNGK